MPLRKINGYTLKIILWSMVRKHDSDQLIWTALILLDNLHAHTWLPNRFSWSKTKHSCQKKIVHLRWASLPFFYIMACYVR